MIHQNIEAARAVQSSIKRDTSVARGMARTFLRGVTSGKDNANMLSKSFVAVEQALENSSPKTPAKRVSRNLARALPSATKASVPVERINGKPSRVFTSCALSTAENFAHRCASRPDGENAFSKETCLMLCTIEMVQTAEERYWYSYFAAAGHGASMSQHCLERLFLRSKITLEEARSVVMKALMLAEGFGRAIHSAKLVTEDQTVSIPIPVGEHIFMGVQVISTVGEDEAPTLSLRTHLHESMLTPEQAQRVARVRAFLKGHKYPRLVPMPHMDFGAEFTPDGPSRTEWFDCVVAASRPFDFHTVDRGPDPWRAAKEAVRRQEMRSV